jgi:malonyl-CoA O-methyltransferase
MQEPYELDRAAIRRAFDRAAPYFDEAAFLHREVRARLLDRLSVLRREPDSILDLGAGTGEGSRRLKDQFPKAQVLAIDHSHAMLKLARKRQGWFKKFHPVCADVEQLPLQTESIDWCVSNIAPAYNDPPDRLFSEIQRVLKPGGLFHFATLGPDTLHELRTAWASVDASPHVHRFIDMHDLGDALVRSGFADPVMDVERIVLTYGDADQLFRELKRVGAVSLLSHRARHLSNRTKLAALRAAYRPDIASHRIAATFEIVYGQAWRGISRQPRHSSEVRISADSIGRRVR